MADERDDTPGNVIDFEARVQASDQGEKPLLHRVYKARDRKFCACRSFEVDYSARIVSCAHCQKDHDPFWVLQVLANGVDFTPHEQEVKRLRALVEHLGREKVRLRAAVQKLRKEAGEGPWTEWQARDEIRRGQP